MLKKIVKIGVLPQIVSAISALAAIRIYSELLSPANLGLVMLVLGVVSLVDALCSMAVNQTVFYFACRVKAQNSTQTFQLFDLRNKKFFLLAFLLIGITVDSIIVLFKAQDYIPPVLSLLVLYAIVDSHKTSNLAILNAFEDNLKFGLLLSFDAVVTLVCTSIAIFISPKPVSLLIGLTFAKLLSLVLGGLLVKQISWADSKFQINEIKNFPVSFNEVKNYVSPFVFMGALGWISNFADRYVLASVSDISTVGIYAVTVGIVGRPYNILSATLTTYFRPGLYKAVASQNISLKHKINMQWLQYAAIVGVFCAVLFYLFADLVVYLLLAKPYQETAKSLMPIVAIGFTLTTCIHAIDNNFLAMNKGKVLLNMQLTTIPISLLIIAVGSSLFGALGGVVGRTLSECIRLIVMMIANLLIYKAMLYNQKDSV